MTLTTEKLRALDRAHHLHPFTNHHRLREGGARIITGAEGVHVRDSDGKRYLDMMSGLWCVNIGYGRAELARAAAAQMEELPYYNSFFQTAQLPAVQLAEALAEVTPPQYNRAFFGTSGSDANDTIVRLARYYWQAQGEKREFIISRRNAYHGSTVAASSLGGMAAMHAQGGPLIPGVAHIAQPYYFAHRQSGGELSEEEFALQTARALEEKILELGAERVAAFIAEPIQGAGGVVIPHRAYWPEIQRICKKHGILLAVDEVICGFGRTGEWFGSDAFAIEGDLMTLAKGLSSGYQPLSAVMVSDRVAAALDRDDEFSHGYTYSGHPVACAVALENIRILRDERIIETARGGVMAHLHAGLQTLAEHPLVGEARITGFIGALELVADKSGNRAFEKSAQAGVRCRDICFDNGLVMRAVGDTMVLAPPLVIRREDVEEFVEKAGRSLDETQKALSG
ncbi:MAG: aminotransferase [Gammaproteobacteria bacterium]|nr:aminotransferase [Gammaproteobacteria bacterium]